MKPCPTLRLMGESGGAGTNRNVARDLYSRMVRHLGVGFTPYPMVVPKIDNIKGLVMDKAAGLNAPHEVFSALYKFDVGHEMFFQIVGEPNAWKTFWEAHHGETWFREHALHDVLVTEPLKCCPYSLAQLLGNTYIYIYIYICGYSGANNFMLFEKCEGIKNECTVLGSSG